ncbi:metal-dependent hydrolase [Paraliomyxa miuraensis]|uniref:metal-dependent hydrolase n=1 Tax=Paraliomyxa miuraensis TaxID=376150 RepID=UPI00225892C2|nr:metal-dependent hydrolase [Paraliomyxa miuraensis]MCX4242443.1 metal-dependent hydrolase [Paraliomyxa miuraensis]
MNVVATPGPAPLGRVRSDRSIARRRVGPDFAAVDAARVWARADSFQADFCNAYTLLLTEEHEFVRVVRHALPETQDPDLRQQLKGWLAQEASHGVQHTRALLVLDRQGLRHRRLLRVLHFVDFGIFARLLGRRLMLRIVAGLEHFNTMLGEMILRHPECLEGADERMALLLRWHFAEEIEHRAVIHDVATAHGMGYVSRVLTGAVAFAFYAFNLFLITWVFAIQRGGLFRLSTHRGALRFLFVDERFVSYLLAYARDYLRPRFHPLDRPIDHVAEPILASIDSRT